MGHCPGGVHCTPYCDPAVAVGTRRNLDSIIFTFRSVFSTQFPGYRGGFLSCPETVQYGDNLILFSLFDVKYVTIKKGYRSFYRINTLISLDHLYHKISQAKKEMGEC